MFQQRNRSCKFCKDIFKTTREWQIFCKDICKYRYHSQVKETCCYCGQYGNHRDHVYPHQYSNFSETRIFRGREYVYSCKECNSTLGGNMFYDFSQRIEYLINKYNKKYYLMRGAVEWDIEEIEELGSSLRKRIKKKLAMRRIAEERVVYLRHQLQLIK